MAGLCTFASPRIRGPVTFSRLRGGLFPRILGPSVRLCRKWMLMASSLAGDTFYLDAFALRQWDDPNYQGSKMHCAKTDFVRRVHEFHAQGAPLVDGYAPFCKHLFIPNIASAKVGCLPITPEIAKHVECGYSSRRPEELAVLSRWIPSKAIDVPEAKFLDVILYSREQILKEIAAMPSKNDAASIPEVPWGIISVKAQDEDHETPMQPITMMRNALGPDEGGSGVPLDKAKYAQAVEYWRDRVPLL